MRLLLDTHVALWAVYDDLHLPVSIQRLIDDPENDVHVSAASVWEIAIKRSLDRRRANDLAVSGAEALADFRDAGFVLLSVSPEHGAAVETLPRLHGDPFDRILLAQALSEPMRLVTHDAVLARYSDTVILF